MPVTHHILNEHIKPPSTVKQNIPRILAGSLLTMVCNSRHPCAACTVFVMCILPFDFWPDTRPFITIVGKTSFLTSHFSSLHKTSSTWSLWVHVSWRSHVCFWDVRDYEHRSCSSISSSLSSIFLLWEGDLGMDGLPAILQPVSRFGGPNKQPPKTWFSLDTSKNIMVI